MMDNVLLLLWAADVVGGLNTAAVFSLGASTILFIMSLLTYDDLKMEVGDEDASRLTKYCLTTMIASIVLLVVMPSKQTIYVAAAGVGAKEVVNTAIGKKSLALLEKKLDEALGEQK
jgi:hypothetical protein